MSRDVFFYPIKPIIDRFFKKSLSPEYTHSFSLKKPTAYRFFVVVSLCLLPATGFSQSPDETGIIMQEALRRTLLQHPELPGYQALLRSAEGYEKQSSVGEPLELSLEIEDAFGTGKYSGFDSTQATLGISWLLQGELLDKRVVAARQRKDQFVTEQEIKRLDIAAETGREFVTAMMVQEKLKLSRTSLSKAETLVDVVKKRVESRASPDADLLRARAAVEKQRMALLDWEVELKASYQSLAAQWGKASPDFNQVSGELTIEADQLEEQRLLSRLSDNPNLRQFINQSRMAESQIALAKAEAKNYWRLNAGVRRFEEDNDYAATFGLRIPLGNTNRNQGTISTLRAEQFAYDANADALHLDLRIQLSQLIASYTRYQLAQSNFNQSLIPQLKQAVQAARKAYQSGAYSYQEWQSVQQELLDTQVALLDVQYRAQLNRIELERISGLALSN